jgi:hypothetical protein
MTKRQIAMVGQGHWASLKRCRGNVGKINLKDTGKMLRTLIIKKFKG